MYSFKKIEVSYIRNNRVVKEGRKDLKWLKRKKKELFDLMYVDESCGLLFFMRFYSGLLLMVSFRKLRINL